MAQKGKRRALGQHFLRDAETARLIARTAVDEAARTGCATLLEIGPGKGAITEPILSAVEDTPAAPSEMVLAERDRDLAALWRTHVKLRMVGGKARPELRVEEGDFLDLPEERWLSRPPLAVASNLPYSAGTAIVIRLARYPERIPVMVLMFQAEVARRLRAEPESKEWGSLSVWIQNRWDVRKLKSVPPGAFAPPPEVDSEVVVLTRRETPRIPVQPGQEDTWEKLLKAAFAHRRKMLRSGLPPGPHRKALEVSGLDGTKRAEALSWEEWGRLFGALISG